MSSSCLHNGKFVERSPLLDNRAFRYGDGLFETMRMVRGRIPMLNGHLQRLLQGMQQLGIEVPEYFPSPKFWTEQARRIAGPEPDHWRLRLQVYRSGGGLYAPETDAPDWLLEATETDAPSMQEEGLRIGISKDSVVAPSPFTAFKTLQSLPYILASREARQRELDDVLLLNTQGRIAESSNSNIWLFDGRVWHSPPLSEGCVGGVLHRWLQAQSLPWSVRESPLERAELDRAEGILLGNSVRGLRWVKELEGRPLTRPEIHATLQASWLNSFL